jgi:type IV pilus assembly protein PilY1
MKSKWKRTTAVVLVGLLATGFGLSEDVSGSCTNGVKIPAFLASGVDPNLLLIIDNSASMYDLAYVGAQGTCYDDTYSAAETYAGYFENNTWYSYSVTNNRFESSPTDPCGSYSYKADDQVCISVDTGVKTVTKFAARGNFLNWAATSKLDIQKKILTGGKYESEALTLESRGCLGRRYVKKIAVKNSSNATSYITLGIRPPETAEKAGSIDDTTRIEIYEVTSTGFNNGPCQAAINELQQPSPNNGQIDRTPKNACLTAASDKKLADAMSAFNHSMQDCWYWSARCLAPGGGSVSRIKNDCEKVYGNEVHPEDIQTEDRAYVCYGDDGPPAKGYVGRCWNGSGWTNDECVDEFLMDYCGILKIPQVVDPSDQVSVTEEMWNIPAVLIDSGVLAQLAQPWLVMTGKITVSAAPSGIIQETAEGIRIGAMIFNDDGSRSECSQTDHYVLYKCADAANKDGARVISEIGKSSAHTSDLIAAINTIKATSWTPLAEALYNAIGYYTQNSSLKLDSGDWGSSDPVCAWCQTNNILLITDGGSTADGMNERFFFRQPEALRH